MTDNRGVDRQVFRPGAGRWFGYAWLVFAAANLADLAWRGHSRTSWVIGSVLLLASAVAYATALRPRIVADGSGVRIINPLRDISVPWGAVTDVTAAETVRVHTRRPRPYRCWAVQVGNRRRAQGRPARARFGGSLRGGTVPDTGPNGARVASQTRTEYVAAELADMAQRAREHAPSDRTEKVTWSRWSLAALSVSVVLVIVASIIP